VPQTTLALTDRLAVRVWVNHSGRTITLHTEDNHLCQIITTFSTGLTALNGLTAQIQTFVNDTNVTIVSASTTHTITWAGILSIARGGTGLSALGTALQQIRVNAGGTALEYFTATTPVNVGSITFQFDGAGGVIPIGQYGGYYVLPYNFQITGWTLTSTIRGTTTALSASIVIDTYSAVGFPNTTSIWGTKPSLVSASLSSATGLSINLTAGHFIGMNVDSSTTGQLITLTITGIKS